MLIVAITNIIFKPIMSFHQIINIAKVLCCKMPIPFLNNTPVSLYGYLNFGHKNTNAINVKLNKLNLKGLIK